MASRQSLHRKSKQKYNLAKVLSIINNNNSDTEFVDDSDSDYVPSTEDGKFLTFLFPFKSKRFRPTK
jgi:hypothetical protein